jgi:hypothetical protein
LKSFDTFVSFHPRIEANVVFKIRYMAFKKIPSFVAYFEVFRNY